MVNISLARKRVLHDVIKVNLSLTNYFDLGFTSHILVESIKSLKTLNIIKRVTNDAHEYNIFFILAHIFQIVAGVVRSPFFGIILTP